jgi:phosphoglycerol transferase MdoB-like AlkP superfamily enzyme
MEVVSRFRLPLWNALFLFVGFQLVRVLLVARFHPVEPQPLGSYARLFLVGLHRDLVVSLLLSTPLGLWCAMTSSRGAKTPGRWSRALLPVFLAFSWLLQVFLLVAEFNFFAEFNSRFNTVAIDYLIYPHEVFANMYQSFPLGWILGGVTAGGSVITWLLLKLAGPSRQTARSSSASSPRRAGSALSWVLPVVLLTATLPLVPWQQSHDRVMNELGNNGLVAGVTAAVTRNLDYTAFYPHMDREAAYRRVKALLATPDSTYVDPHDVYNLRRQIHGRPGSRPLNVCLLMEESLGSEFWGSLGRTKKDGTPHTLTPHLDRLANEEGWLFDNLWADGNRTIRGFEGILASFPPLPGDSIVARDRTENVETLGRVMTRQGYETLFMYAGRSLFDGMGPFAIKNGWKRFLHQGNFEKPAFTNAWGVSNEDLYARAILEMRSMHETGKPFLLTMLSVSNHVPFTYPAGGPSPLDALHPEDGKVAPDYPQGRISQNPDEHRREFAVRYVDWCLGRFFQEVKKEPFWQDTLFVVVADHGARVYGSQAVPIKSYEIPMLVLGPAVVKQPQRQSMLACQLDVAPTILGLTGQPYESLFFGRDLLHTPETPFAKVLMHHNREVASYRDERMVVFGLNQSMEFFGGNPKSGKMAPLPGVDPRSAPVVDDATALFQVADDLYMNRRYRIDGVESSAGGVEAGQTRVAKASAVR